MSTRNMLVMPAPDCRASRATLPPRRDRATRATLEYDFITGAPYMLDHKALTYAVHVAMAEAADRPALSFEAFHAKAQPCMRTSPLTKSYGWAAHYDKAGRLALLDPASREYARLAAAPELPRAAAMRSKRR